MTILTVTAQGKVTLGKDVLQHLGIQPGGEIQFDLLPGGRMEIRADRPKGSSNQIGGMLKGQGNGAKLSIEELDDATAEAGAEAGMAGMEK